MNSEQIKNLIYKLMDNQLIDVHDIDKVFEIIDSYYKFYTK